MSIASLIEDMAAAGAPISAIVMAVREIEERDAVDAERRAKAAERKRRERDRRRDSHATVTGQSRDTPQSPPLSPTPPNTPPISPQTIPDEARDAPLDQGPVSEPDYETLGRELANAGGRALVNPAGAPGLLVLSDPMNWIRNGCDLQADILPAIRARCSRARPSSIRSWNYFTEAVYQARDNRLKPTPEPNNVQPSRTSRSAAASPHDNLFAALTGRAGTYLEARGGSEPDPDAEPSAYDGRTIDLVAVGR
ncbi:hypothetical protein [Pleomorphomonas sp. JP5]|uniref:hypothetical protein n=1 Tax=Pleomorphomonas sp. JP5 TaxID=2942998 RepID=UPI002044BC8B|nr:hypothetical protein [Pleomorphomonas sp. JP5]MCM5558504.1 hypothetical protein [Pleomorphomonas sp. JP5]